MSKNINFTELETKILEFALADDDRLQQHYAKELFNCHYLPDIVQHLRPKLGLIFDVTDGTKILPTEYHSITKIDGKNARIGIYRLNDLYKEKIKSILEDDKEVE